MKNLLFMNGPSKLMGPALHLQPHQSLRLISSSFSYVTSNVNNHRARCYLQPPHQKVLHQQSMKYLTLKSNPFRFRFIFNQPNLFCAINISNNNNNNCTLFKDTMADNSPSVNGNSAILNDKKEEEKNLEKSTPRCIPPPPEKPLPDDCCGSGCVRCVWDIYYEELEAYNKLYKTTSPHSSDASGASAKQS